MGFCERSSESESPARFEVCSGQLELGVGAGCSDSSRISLFCSRGLSGFSASLFSLSNLPSAATSAYALACPWCNSGEWRWLFLALARQLQQFLSRACGAAGQLPIFRLLRSSSSFFLSPALQQLQQHATAATSATALHAYSATAASYHYQRQR